MIDASVALKWFVSEPHSDLALLLIERGQQLIAPELLMAEFANALWVKWRRGEVTEAQMDGAVARLRPPLIELRRHQALSARGLALARSLNHPAYDCFYLALAESESARLVTADRRLVEAATAAGLVHLVECLAPRDS